MASCDVSVLRMGTVVSIVPVTEVAQEWCQDHLPEDAPRLGRSYVVEWRYADDILAGMADDGLVVVE